jgi:DNA-binding XRE family transcriptional regulator
MKSTSYDFPTVVRMAREHAGYTSYAKVHDAGCSTRYLADIESGKYRPSPTVAADLGITYKSKRLIKVYCDTCDAKCAMNKISKEE